MLKKSLKQDETLAGRSVEMTITVTGKIVDSYDTYIDIYASCKNTSISVKHQLFVRLIFWETTHKQIVIGSVSVLDANGCPKGLIECIERTSVPVEKKDYWKKMYEKALVIEIAQCFGREAGLLWLNNKWIEQNSVRNEETPDPCINQVAVHTCPIATFEYIKRNMRVDGNGVRVVHPEAAPAAEDLNSKCYEGPHGFVRSDDADGFELKLTSMPVSMIVK